MNRRLFMSAAAGLLPLVVLPFDAAVIVGSGIAVLTYRWIPRLPDAAADADQRTRELAMPIALDVLWLGLEAGISWDRATRYASTCVDGSLREDLARAADRLALGAAAREVWLDGLRPIAEVVERSSHSGASVAALLRQQADALRAAERLRRVERSRRLGEQILVPVTLLGMPGFFLLALLPTLASIAGSLQLGW